MYSIKCLVTDFQPVIKDYGQNKIYKNAYLPCLIEPVLLMYDINNYIQYKGLTPF